MTLVLRGATLIDGRGGAPVASSTVVVDGDRISSVGASRNGARVPKDAEVLDLEGLTVLPGLIDAHTHLGSSSFASGESLAEVAAQVFGNVGRALDAGFTTCRELGGVDGGMVKAIGRGLVRGPRIFPSAFVCQTGGHGDLTPAFTDRVASGNWAGLCQAWRPADGPDAIRLELRKGFRNGGRQVKVCVTGGVVSLHDDLEDTQFTVDELRSAVMEAKSRRTYVTAHTHNNQGIRNGLEAGVECFEHGTAIDEETAQMMADAGAAHVPTLAVAHTFVQEFEKWGLPRQILPRIQGVEDGMANAARTCAKAGILVGLGSDLIGPQQERRGLEVTLRAKVQSPMDAIVAATAVNAKIMRMDDELGTVEAGKLADLVVVDGDPLAEPELFDDPSRVVLVVVGGEVCKDIRGERAARRAERAAKPSKQASRRRAAASASGAVPPR